MMNPMMAAPMTPMLDIAMVGRQMKCTMTPTGRTDGVIKAGGLNRANRPTRGEPSSRDC